MTRGAPSEPQALTGLTRFLVVALAVFGLASALGVLSDLDQWRALNDARTGDLDMARAEASDARAMLAAVLQLTAALAAAAPFCMWILRANQTARALAPGTVLTPPVWAIGWYLVPIANLWRPYRAMQEIWTASLPPGGAPPRSPLPPWWLALISVVALAYLSGTAAASAGDDIDRLLWAAQLELAGDIAAVLLAASAARVVRQICRLQVDRARERAASRSAPR